jgi:hypothetical protein
MSNQLLDGYEQVKASSGSGKKTPIVKITEGTFLKGVLVNKKSKSEFVFNEKGEKVEKITLIATFKLISTDAPMILKGNAGYAPVTDVPAGTEVTIYGAPTRLRTALETIEADGSQEVYIVYEGKKKEKFANGKSGSAHNFKVGKKAVVNVELPTDSIPD